MICEICSSKSVDRNYIDVHEVLHCICSICGHEWIE